MNLTRFDETGSNDPSLSPALLNYEARMKESFGRGINKLEEAKTSEDESPVFDRMPTVTDLAKSAYNAPLDMMISEYKRMKEMPLDEMQIENAMNLVPFGATTRFTKKGIPLSLIKNDMQELIKTTPSGSLSAVPEASAYDQLLSKYRSGMTKKQVKEIGSALDKANPNDPWVHVNHVPTHMAPQKDLKLTGTIGSKEVASDPTFVDPFMWADSKYNQTKGLLQKYKESETPIREINTGSDLIARDDYLELIPRETKINLYLTPGIELAPGRPSNRRLYNAFEKLKTNGFDVELHNPERILIDQLPKTHLYKNVNQQDLDDLLNKELNEIEKLKKVIPIK